MQKNDFKRWLWAVVLTAALVVVGCGGSGGGGAIPDPAQPGGNGAAGGGGGGAGAAVAGGVGGVGGVVGGTTGLGLTGGTTPGGGGGGGGATGGAAGTTGGATGTTGGTTGAATGATNNFLNAVTATDLYTSQSNPTQFAVLGGRVYFLRGFGLGVANGQLVSFSLTDALANPTNQPGLTVMTNLGGNVTSLTNPWGITASGTDLIITDGANTIDGRIIRVSGITATGTQGAFNRIANQGGLVLRNPSFCLAASVDGGNFVYWTDYTSLPFGSVRRARTDGTGTPELVLDQLNFPAGLATDGTNLIVCDSGGGANGQVLRLPLSFAGTTLTPASALVTVITPATGQQAITRPFDVAFDGANGFFFTEGNAIEGITGTPSVTGPGNGAVRFIARAGTAAQIISNGLNNCAGIAAAQISGTTSGVLFTESVILQGRVLRRSVDTANVTIAAPSVVDTGIDRPIDVGIFNTNTPQFMSIVNYTGGVNNGLVKFYRP